MAVDLISERVPVEEIAADAAEVDRTGAFPARAVDALREAGLLGIAVPEAFGGRGASLAEIAARGRARRRRLLLDRHGLRDARLRDGDHRRGCARRSARPAGRHAPRDRGRHAPHDARLLGARHAEPLLGAGLARASRTTTAS